MLKNIIIDYPNAMKSKYKSDFNDECKMYNKIRNSIKLFGKHVGVLVFISFLSNALVIIIKESGSLHPKI